jgi:hypothetical protein
MYSELTYFDGAHFAHIARYLEHLRIERLKPGSYPRWRVIPSLPSGAVAA